MKGVCGNCKWWHRPAKAGYCHRSAPSPTPHEAIKSIIGLLSAEKSEQELSSIAYAHNLTSSDEAVFHWVQWPFTYEDDFCGEFKEK